MPVSVKFGSGRQMSRGFPSRKNTSFLIVRTNISTSTRREKASVVVGQSAPVAYPGILFGGGEGGSTNPVEDRGHR